MARAYPSLTAADMAVSAALQGNLTLFKAIVRAKGLEPAKLEIFETETEFDPVLHASLVYEVAKRGHTDMLRHLLAICRMTPHLPTATEIANWQYNEVNKHNQQLRDALSEKLFQAPGKIMPFGGELNASINIIAYNKSLIPRDAFSHALAAYAEKCSEVMNISLRLNHKACIRLLKKWEAKVPMPVYVPPAKISAEDYETAYQALHQKLRRVEELVGEFDLTLD